MTTEPTTDGRRVDVVERVADAFWHPHSNPRSVWTLVATYSVLVLALYRRSRPLFVVSLLSVVVSLTAVSPPETDEAWATRVVRGERIWLERGLRSRPDALGLTAVGAVVNLYTLRAAIARRRGRTTLGATLSLLLTFAFFDRMARIYDDAAASPTDTPER